MWSGKIADIPLGWGLCDGTNGTPDLRDRFIVGARQDVGGVAKTNLTNSFTQTGGSITITEANLPSHTHGVGSLIAANESTHTHSINHNHGMSPDNRYGEGTYENPSNEFTVRTDNPSGSRPIHGFSGNSGAGSSHTHSLSGSTGATGSGTAYAQPYYALAFIMKL